MAEVSALLPVAGVAAFYAAAGLGHAAIEVARCRAENERLGEAAPLWPVWIVVSLLWPMLLAQRAVLGVLTLWDAAAARRADRQEARHG